MTQLFRKNAIVVEARQVPTQPDASQHPEGRNITGYVDESIEIADWCGGKSYMMHSGPQPGAYYRDDPGYDHILIPTLEGDMRARAGSWIIKGTRGEFWPCHGDIFPQTYAPLVTEVDLADAEAFKAARMQHVQVTFQEGHLKETGVNGCFVEDVVQVAIDRLEKFQRESLACAENEAALGFLKAALQTMARRRSNRTTQGVANSYERHTSEPVDQLIAEFDPHLNFPDEADVRHIYGQL